jgi:integrase
MKNKSVSTTRRRTSVALSESAKRYVRKSKAPSTIRTYAAMLKEFEFYVGDLPATPETVANYLTTLADAGQKVNTIEVKLAAIAYAHRANGLPDPTVSEKVKEVINGIRREIGRNPTKKEPATLTRIDAMVNTLDLDKLKGKRDRALLLIGIAGAFRRSELTALDVADLHRDHRRLRITVRRSKTDQEAKGSTKTIPIIGGYLCPVSALYAWLEAAKISSGPVFRRVDRHGNIYGRLTPQSVALVVKETARAAGLDWRSFSGHSLRRGFITEAMDAGANDSDIVEQTGQKTDTMRDYRKNSGVGAARAVLAVFGVEEEHER